MKKGICELIETPTGKLYGRGDWNVGKRTRMECQHVNLEQAQLPCLIVSPFSFDLKTKNRQENGALYLLFCSFSDLSGEISFCGHPQAGK